MTSPASISTQSQCGMPSTARVPERRPFFRFLHDAIGNSADMTIRRAAGDHHGVGECSLAF